MHQVIGCLDITHLHLLVQAHMELNPAELFPKNGISLFIGSFYLVYENSPGTQCVVGALLVNLDTQVPANVVPVAAVTIVSEAALSRVIGVEKDAKSPHCR